MTGFDGKLCSFNKAHHEAIKILRRNKCNANHAQYRAVNTSVNEPLWFLWLSLRDNLWAFYSERAITHMSQILSITFHIHCKKVNLAFMRAKGNNKKRHASSYVFGDENFVSCIHKINVPKVKTKDAEWKLFRHY